MTADQFPRTHRTMQISRSADLETPTDEIHLLFVPELDRSTRFRVVARNYALNLCWPGKHVVLAPHSPTQPQLST